jgi:hypothetical protein
MRAILVLVIAVLTACAANPQRVEAPAQAEADKLTPPTKSLSSFSHFELKPMAFDDAIEADEGRRKKAEAFEQSLRQRLSPLLESWRVTGNDASSDSLSIETKLVRLRIVSKATRQFTPSVAVGDSHIDMDLRLTDTTTGDEIANLQIRAKARQWGSAYTGVSDDTLDDYVVAVVHKYLSDNY